MKKLLLLLLAIPAWGQVYDGIALQKMPGNWVQAIPFAKVTVCTSSATGNPCSPLALLFTDQTLSVGTPNPLTADVNGNYTIYAPSGVYLVCVSGTSSQCNYVSTAGGGFVCGTILTAGLPYWNGTQCILDAGASFDPVAIQWNFEAIVSSGTITAAKFATSGAGGILEMKSQAAPTPGAGLYDIYIDSGTGLLGCRNSVPASCLTTVQTIASGTATMGTAAIASGVCAAAVTATATGTLTTDRIVATPNVDPTGVSGYAPSASGSLYIQAFPTANTVSFKVCNNTSGSITPAALTLNWAVLR